jgi:hypothetical protein
MPKKAPILLKWSFYGLAMSDKLLLREWIGIGIVLASIFTILIVSKISERKIYNLLENAWLEAKIERNRAK